MKKVKLIHSFSTKPLENNSLYQVERLHHLISDIWMYTLSACYARREGFDIELYTDSLGAALLSKAPYNNIHVILDDMPNNIHPRFWAASKVFALEQAGDNIVHTDGDVFIKNGSLLNIQDDIDYIVQHQENVNYRNNGECALISNQFENFLSEYGLDLDLSTPYNMGIIGIFNQELRNKYISAYKDLASKITMQFQKELNNDFVTPDLLVEQLQFTQLSKEYKGHTIIPKENVEVPPNGYQHLTTSYKYSECITNKIKQTLKKFFPGVYEQTLKLCRNI